MNRIADIKKMERCEKLLWWSKKEPQSFLPYVYYHENIYDLALEKLKLTEKACLTGQVGDDNDVFFTQEEKYDVFLQMRFTYQDLRIRIPLMVKKKNGYHIYFLYASCYPKESEAQSFADQMWVLKHLGIRVNKVQVVHLNAEYVREKTLDVEKLLLVSDVLYNEKNHPGERIAVLMKQRKRDITPILAKMEEVLSLEEIEKKRTNICTRRNKCPYFDYCFPSDNKDTSVLNLVSSAKKFTLLEEGITDLKDVDMDQIEGTRHQFAQIMAAKSGQLFFDVCAVKQFFKQITYPISYLDFEWETYAYPPYEGMKPFDVLTFQYSLHIEDASKEITHKEYLGMRDCREEFVVQLLKDIPKEGSVMCYNVEGAEKLRLKQLAKQFPQYEEDLRQIWERMVDLSIPFSSGLIYDNRMAGMYSLKKLVSLFTDYSYADLDISHGMEAVRNYRMLDEEDAIHQEAIRKDLLAYCAMDTYAMVLIYHWVLEEIQKRSVV